MAGRPNFAGMSAPRRSRAQEAGPRCQPSARLAAIVIGLATALSAVAACDTSDPRGYRRRGKLDMEMSPALVGGWGMRNASAGLAWEFFDDGTYQQILYGLQESTKSVRFQISWKGTWSNTRNGQLTITIDESTCRTDKRGRLGYNYRINGDDLVLSLGDTPDRIFLRDNLADFEGYTKRLGCLGNDGSWTDQELAPLPSPL